MKMIKCIILIITTLIIVKGEQCYAQDTTYTEAFKSLPDTTQLRILIEHSDLCEVNDMLYYVEKALVIGKRVYDKNPKSGHAFYYAAAYNNKGFYYDQVGNIEQSVKSYLKSLEIREEINDSLGMAESYNNLAYMFQHQRDKATAIRYYDKSWKIFEAYKDTTGLLNVCINKGFVYYQEQKYDSAQFFFEHGKELAIATDDMGALGFALNNLAAIYYKQGDYQKTEEAYLESLALREQVGRRNEITRSHHNIGRFYMERGDMKKSLKHAQISYQLSKEEGSPDLLSDASLLLSDIYYEKKEFKKSHDYLIIHNQMKDSILSDETQKSAVKQQIEYEYEKQKLVDDAEYEKQLAISAEQKKQQQVITYAVAGGLILVIIFSVIIFKRLQVTKQQKLIIENQKVEVEIAHHQLAEKNTEILDSITYAKRIQEAILPSIDSVKELLPNSFILYKPKDIVAGDFYWMDQREGNVLFAVADCTGHGVPGAMVSVVCHNAIDRVIRDYNLLDPGKILDKTRELIVEQFDKSENVKTVAMKNIRDGMDIALCVLNTKTNELEYAGANNPLWFLKKGTDVIEEVKANKQSIGKVDNPQKYKTHRVQLNKGDSIYVFSDGFADQFGGEKGKKFKYRPFKELLVSVSKEPMENQLNTINNHFETWRGDLEQVDDVCVIGVRI